MINCPANDMAPAATTHRAGLVYFGVTAAEAAQASALGNPMTAYVPGSGLGTVGMTATSVYAMTEHWGFEG
jgi:outer membrane scaffolding protein for murein synthesis (MipA/OmpV family)